MMRTDAVLSGDLTRSGACLDESAREQEGDAMSVSLKSLIGKLNDTCRKALDAAAGLCLTRTHYDVDIEHFLPQAQRSAGQRHPAYAAAL